MSLRVLACFLVVLALCVQAWRGKWFFAACGAVVLMAFVERRDMPRHIMGIPGLNLWNILIFNVVCAWLIWRPRQGLVWDIPRGLKIAFCFYLFVILWAFFRLFINPTHYCEEDYSQLGFIMDFLINPLKFLLPGLILFDGCRTRANVSWALGAILLMYFILSILVIKSMGLGGFSGSELSGRAARVIPRDVGYNRVDMSMMLAGASWGFIALSRLAQQLPIRAALWAAAGVALVGQALTGGRAGYITWATIGLSLCVLKWRKMLPLIPVAVAIAVALVPGIRERMFQGFADKSGNIVSAQDADEMTAGRVNAWPYVIAQIEKSPIIGYGRLAMVRTGLSTRLEEELQDEFGHPHNAYLETLLDNGVVGFLCVMPFYCLLLVRCFSLFLDRDDRLVEVAGGVALALLLALLLASMGAQTLYPREGVVGMWAALGVAIRVWVARADQAYPGLIMTGEIEDMGVTQEQPDEEFETAHKAAT